MFASDAPMSDESVVVEAITAEGRRVDPYSEVAGRIPYPGVDEIPTRLDNDSFFFNYSGRIPDQGVYHQAFLEWILRYPIRTGHPGDRIVRFDAYKVENDSPPPGETQPRNVRKQSSSFSATPPKRLGWEPSEGSRTLPRRTPLGRSPSSVHAMRLGDPRAPNLEAPP